jgi:uncharacterized LabA/DUF88 family protein
VRYAIYNGPKEVDYLFVDGAALDRAVAQISERYLGPNASASVVYPALANGFSKMFYYDGFPVQDPAESPADFAVRFDEAKTRFDRVRGIDRVHLYLGDKRGRKQGRQKKVDVMITVDMLNHTIRGNMQKATLLAGDIDFEPLLDALVREGMFVTLWHPPQAADELKNAADARRPLDVKSLLPIMLTAGGASVSPRDERSVQKELKGDRQGEWSNAHGNCILVRDADQFLMEVRTGDRIDQDGQSKDVMSYITAPSCRAVIAYAQDFHGLPADVPLDG